MVSDNINNPIQKKAETITDGLNTSISYDDDKIKRSTFIADNNMEKIEQNNGSRMSISVDDDIEIKDIERFQTADVEKGLNEKKNASSSATTKKSVKQMHNNIKGSIKSQKANQNWLSSTEATKMSHPTNINVCLPIKSLQVKRVRTPINRKEPTLIFQKRDQAEWMTCPWLWNSLGDRYGTPLSQLFSKGSKNTLLLQEEDEDFNLKHFDSCQVNATSIYITGHDLLHDSVLKFTYECRLYRRHVYTFQFPKMHTPTSRSAFLKICNFATQIVDCAIECWYLGWQVAVFMDVSSIEKSFVCHLLHILRDNCDKETLDIVILASKYSAKGSKAFFKAGASTIVTDTNKFLEKLKSIVNEETIKFYENYEKYYEFTNFSYISFMKNEYLWKTSEHYFQAHKFVDRELFDKVRQAYSPRNAFDIGRNSPNVRADWNIVDECGISYKERVMIEGTWAKFKYNRSLALKLLSTGGATLVEHTKKDGYWGDNGDGTGQNRLGLILENIRYELFLEELERINSTDHFEERALKRAEWYIEDLQDLLKLGLWT